jgi:hypothetical protein
MPDLPRATGAPPGIPATIVVPRDALAIKLANTVALRAE